jgi:NADPH-dependent 7-cyano-7-deazaguanine reductase QueF-like protein
MKKIIFTDHAYERMYLRAVSKSLVQATVDHHDDSEYENDGDTQFIKTIKRSGNKREIHVVAKPLPKEGKDTWLIKTVWVDGEEDPKLLLKTFRMLLMRLLHRKKSQR